MFFSRKSLIFFLLRPREKGVATLFIEYCHIYVCVFSEIGDVFLLLLEMTTVVSSRKSR